MELDQIKVIETYNDTDLRVSHFIFARECLLYISNSEIIVSMETKNKAFIYSSQMSVSIENSTF